MTPHAATDRSGPAAAPGRKPRVYLAGPDVFFHDSRQIFDTLIAQCDALGLTGWVPCDGGVPEGVSGNDDDLAQCIYEGNVLLIDEADGVVANLMSFRGHEPDSGTVFEVGYAIARGKPVVAYGVAPGSYADRVSAMIACAKDSDGITREIGSGVMVEGLGQRLNLMLARSVVIETSAVAALQCMARLLGCRASRA